MFLFCLILQDTLGGGFDATQAFVGELANLNIWNRKLSVAEIYNLATCNSKASAGNVFSWTENNIEIFGGATKWTFEPCRSLNWTEFHRSRKASLYFWAFVVLVFIWRLLETIWSWVSGKLKSGISIILRYLCAKQHFSSWGKKNRLGKPQWESIGICFSFFFSLGRVVESTPKLFVLAYFVLDWQLAICALCLDNSQSKWGIT